MAFKTISEYQKMRRKDPQEAERLLRQAANTGKDPVSQTNSGYSKAGLQRRLQRGFRPGEGNPVPGPNKRPRNPKYKRRQGTPVPGPRYPTTR